MERDHTTQMLYDELYATIRRYGAESDVTVLQVIALLEVLKLDLVESFRNQK